MGANGHLTHSHPAHAHSGRNHSHHYALPYDILPLGNSVTTTGAGGRQGGSAISSFKPNEEAGGVIQCLDGGTGDPVANGQALMSLYAAVNSSKTLGRQQVNSKGQGQQGNMRTTNLSHYASSKSIHGDAMLSHNVHPLTQVVNCAEIITNTSIPLLSYFLPTRAQLICKK